MPQSAPSGDVRCSRPSLLSLVQNKGWKNILTTNYQVITYFEIVFSQSSLLELLQLVQIKPFLLERNWDLRFSCAQASVLPWKVSLSLSLRLECCCGVNQEGQAALASTNSQGNSHVVPYAVHQENVWFSWYPNSSKSNHVYRNTEHIKKSLCCFNIKAELKAAVKLPQLSAELTKVPDAAAAKFLNRYSRQGIWHHLTTFLGWKCLFWYRYVWLFSPYVATIPILSTIITNLIRYSTSLWTNKW